MHAELEQLLVLQDRQQKIKQIETEIKTLPLQKNNLEAQLAASAASVETLKQKARQVEIDRKKLELDVGTRTESITRLKTQQYQTRKNDEFQAIGHEILTVRNPEKLAASAAARKPTMKLLPYGIPLAVGSIAYFAFAGLLF